MLHALEYVVSGKTKTIGLQAFRGTDHQSEPYLSVCDLHAGNKIAGLRRKETEGMGGDADRFVCCENEVP